MQPDLTSTENIHTFGGLVASLDEKLRAAGAGSAEIAFGMGFGIGIIPVLAIIALLLILKVINLILAFILAAMALLALVGVGMLLAVQARRNAMRRVYQVEVEPEILRYLARTGLSRQKFDLLASQRLPPDAPLQTFLNPPPGAIPLENAES